MAVTKQDGKWLARWRDPSGRQRAKTFERKRDAEHFLVQLTADKQRGLYVDPRAGRITLREHAEGWLASQGGEATTRETVGYRFRNQILPALGATPLAGLRPSQIQAWISQLEREGCSAAHRRVLLANLSGCLKAAVDDQLIGRNPCAAVRAPRTDTRKIIPWPRDCGCHPRSPPRALQGAG